MAAGDTERARALLDQALGLWRGEQAFEGISDILPVAAEARWLGEVRLAAMCARIDIDLQLGRHRELVSELTALTGEHPLDERFWAQLMTALRDSGRPAKALAAYDRARRVIAEETGLDPGTELRELQRAILAGERSHRSGQAHAEKAPLPGAPWMLPPDVGDFTGRRSELAAIMAALADAPRPSGAADQENTDGVVPVAALSGQGGVGKTALAVHVGHRLASTYPDGQLFATLSGAQVADADPDEVLARFLRALGVPGRAVPDAGEERGAMYRSLVARRKMLLVLDDAVDEAQVQPLLPGTASCGVIITSRTRLGGLAGASHVDLAPLPAEDGYQLLEQIVGPERAASDPGAARELVALCTGLPLALRIAGSRLASRPHWSIGELTGQLTDERNRLDALCHHDLEVRASFALSYRGLGAVEQRLFRLLGLLDAPDMTRWSAAALLDASPEEAEELLEVLADARLIEVIGVDETEQRRYRFHDLVRLYAKELAEAEETEQARMAALSRVFAALLSLTDAVHRAHEGGDYTIIVGDAPRWRPDDAEAAVTASGSPLAWLRAERLSLAAAVRQAAALNLDELCWELAAGAEVLYQTGGYNDDWQQTHQLALAATEKAGNQRGHAMVLHLLASYRYLRRDITEAKEYTDRALALFEQIGERYGYALAKRKLAEYERNAGRFSSAIALARQARELLTALSDPVAAADCLILEGIASLEGGNPGAAADACAQAVIEARAIGSWVVMAHGSYWLALAHLALGHHDKAAAAVAEMSQLICVMGDRIGAIYACHAHGALALAREDFTTARKKFQAGLKGAREIPDPLMQVRFLTSLGELCQAQGRHEDAVGLLTEAATVSEDRGFLPLRARALRQLGDACAAIGDLQGARAARRKAAAIAAEMGLRRRL
jgi:tetratricopeptide (TPR) repeat protein